MQRPQDQRLTQELENLAGIRRLGGNLARAAVRIEDLNGLLRLDTELKSVKADDSVGVTVEEFNALVDDVHLLHTRLMAVVQALRVRLGRVTRI